MIFCFKKSLGKKPARFANELLPHDAAFEKLLAPYFAAVTAKEQEPLGITLPYAYKRKSNEHNIGDALCEGMREIAGAQIAIHNLGGAILCLFFRFALFFTACCCYWKLIGHFKTF